MMESNPNSLVWYDSFLGIKKAVFYLVIIGLVFFSGSIYGLATNELSTFDFKTIAMVTPLGGLLLILAWFTMLIGIIRNKVD